MRHHAHISECTRQRYLCTFPNILSFVNIERKEQILYSINFSRNFNSFNLRARERNFPRFRGNSSHYFAKHLSSSNLFFYFCQLNHRQESDKLESQWFWTVISLSKISLIKSADALTFVIILKQDSKTSNIQKVTSFPLKKNCFRFRILTYAAGRPEYAAWFARAVACCRDSPVAPGRPANPVKLGRMAPRPPAAARFCNINNKEKKLWNNSTLIRVVSRNVESKHVNQILATLFH